MNSDAAKAPTLLVVDDDFGVLALIDRLATEMGFSVVRRSGGRAALASLPQIRPDGAIIDVGLSDIDGLSVLREIKAADQQSQVILMTGSAIDRLRRRGDQGRRARLHHEAVRSRSAARAADHRSQEPRAARDAAAHRRGRRATVRVLRADRPQPRDAGAVRLGASLRALRSHRARHRRDRHRQGARRQGAAQARARRKDRRLITVNCSAVVETLFESELFGHVRGAFTGATETKVGLFEHADYGTIFLDEVGELPLPLQAKMLRDRGIRRSAARRLARDAQRRRVRDRRDQPRPAQLVVAGQVPQRPVLSSEHHRTAHSAAARSARGHPLPHRGVHPRIRDKAESPDQGHHARRPNGCCSSTCGRATCASCVTSSSARAFSRTAAS